jgi:hypothetical protein
MLGGSQARAEFINWSYSWSIGPAPVLASGTGTVAQALYHGGSETGSQIIRAAAITTSSSATAGKPDHFAKSFDLVLHLTDAQSHQSRNLTFHGLIVGTLTSSSSHLSEIILDPIRGALLGKHLYLVTLPSHLALMRPGASVIPILSATVRVQDVGFLYPGAQSAMIHTASVRPAPEPSTLALGGVGAVLLALRMVRRCRRPAPMV